MAVWGIGAYYDEDKSKEFIKNGIAYIGWDKKDASVLHNMLDYIRIGDIIYLKSFAPKTQTLTIKAVGIVTNTQREVAENHLKDRLSTLGTGVLVEWKESFKEQFISITPNMYKNNVFNNTIYQEFNKNIINTLIKALINS